MSNMDALTETTGAVKQAAAWGHQAIAITDHGALSRFPEAMKAASKAKVAGADSRISRSCTAVKGIMSTISTTELWSTARETGFCQEYVAFDLETTGLSSQHDEIIEIGAVILKRGQGSGPVPKALWILDGS